MLANIALKTMASTPRPHFMDTCKPDLNKLDCQGNNGYVGEIQYMRYFHFGSFPRNVVFDVSICQEAIDAGTSLLRVNDSMKSFPSGHSQLALFAGLFVFVSMNFSFANQSLMLWAT